MPQKLIAFHNWSGFKAGGPGFRCLSGLTFWKKNESPLKCTDYTNISQRLIFSWDRRLFAEEGAKIIILISKEAENHNGPWNKIGVLSFFGSEIGMCVRDFCRVRGFPHYRHHHHHTESRELFFGSTMPRQLPWINNARSSEINSLPLWENVPLLVGRLWGNVLFFARLCQHFCLRRAMTKVLRFAASSFPKCSHHYDELLQAIAVPTSCKLNSNKNHLFGEKIKVSFYWNDFRSGSWCLRNTAPDPWVTLLFSLCERPHSLWMDSYICMSSDWSQKIFSRGFPSLFTPAPLSDLFTAATQSHYRQ